MKLQNYILTISLVILGFTICQAQTTRGKATYYAKRATGARTASGERLHHDSMTCAHKTYPFGTLLKVTNLSNNKEVIVRVTDRGPYRKGTIVDLSWGAAKEIGMLSKGVQAVKVEVVNDTKIPYRPKETKLPTLEIAEAEPLLDKWEKEREAKAAEKAGNANSKDKTASHLKNDKSADAEKDNKLTLHVPGKTTEAQATKPPVTVKKKTTAVKKKTYKKRRKTYRKRKRK